MLWPGFLEAWLALTSFNYHRKLLRFGTSKQWSALTILRATDPNWPHQAAESILTVIAPLQGAYP